MCSNGRKIEHEATCLLRSELMVLLLSLLNLRDDGFVLMVNLNPDAIVIPIDFEFRKDGLDSAR